MKTDPFDPQLNAEPKALALALFAVMREHTLGKDKTIGTAALIELMAWWVRAEADQNGCAVASILSPTIDVLIARAFAAPEDWTPTRSGIDELRAQELAREERERADAARRLAQRKQGDGS